MCVYFLLKVFAKDVREKRTQNWSLILFSWKQKQNIFPLLVRIFQRLWFIAYFCTTYCEILQFVASIYHSNDNFEVC